MFDRRCTGWTASLRLHGRKVVLATLGVLLLVGATATGALAQETTAVNSQTFRPAVGPHAIFTLETSETLNHLQPTGGMVLNYANDPVVFTHDEDGRVDPIIDNQLAGHLVAGLGVFDHGQLDVEMPVYFANEGRNINDTEIEGGVIGDLTLRGKGTILARPEYDVGLAGGVDLVLPSGQSDALVGAASTQLVPRIMADYRIQEVMVAANLGARIQEDTSLANVDVGERLEYGLGAETEVVEDLLTVGAELYGSTQLTSPFGEAEESPLEALLGAKAFSKEGFSLSAALGGGISPGLGTPSFRAMFGVRYAMTESDRDNDGIPDEDDQCPDEPEDRDGFEDSDGCPDPDNDGDDVPDEEDRCPDTPGPLQNDGCPTEDDEGEEPAEEEEADEDAEDEEQESPEDDQDDERADKDGDGVADEDDECPDEPGLAENDGCPDKAELADESIEIEETVQFESEKAVIDEDSYPLLEEVAIILEANPDIRRVEVAGHTDADGDKEYNEDLSQSRAEAVRTFLIDEGGIDGERLEAKGFGSSQPVIAGDSPKARAQNRRVEFNIVEQGDADGDGADSDDDDS